jgi:galactose mutarotase-like enzyme
MTAFDLVLAADHARLTLRPDRGGIATALAIDGRDVLFLDQATLADPAKNVRGGIPVLFPSPGKLDGDRWARGGASGAMKQHGFARNLPWRVLGTLGGAAPAVALELSSSAETRAQYPWDFALQLTYTLCGRALRIDQRVENRGASAMPFGLGFHPYFFVRDADKRAARVETAATRAFDNVTKQVVELRGPIDLARPEVDLHLIDHDAPSCTLSLPGGAVELHSSGAYRRWVIWTLAGRDFICLEPWTCPGNALNTGEGLIELAPGEAFSAWIEIVA